MPPLPLAMTPEMVLAPVFAPLSVSVVVVLAVPEPVTVPLMLKTPLAAVDEPDVRVPAAVVGRFDPGVRLASAQDDLGEGRVPLFGVRQHDLQMLGG